MDNPVITGLGRTLSNYNLLSSDKINGLKSRLKVGQLVRGKVIDVLPGNKYVFRLNGLNLIAQSSVQMKIGMIVYAFVSETSPKIILKWAKGKTEKNRLKNGLKKLGVNSNLANKLIAERLFELEDSITSEKIVHMVEEVSAKMTDNENEEELKKVINSVIGVSNVTQGQNIEDHPKTVRESMSVINRNLMILSANLPVSGLTDDENLKFIKIYLLSRNGIKNDRDFDTISMIGKNFGLSHEASVYQSIKKNNLSTFGTKSLNLKSSLIGMIRRIKDLISLGYNIQILNKLLTSADKIVKEMDVLRMSSQYGMQLALLFAPIDNSDDGTSLWQFPDNEKIENEWKAVLEFNIEPLGKTEVTLEIKNKEAKVVFKVSNHNAAKIASERISLFSKKLESIGFTARVSSEELA